MNTNFAFDVCFTANAINKFQNKKPMGLGRVQKIQVFFLLLVLAENSYVWQQYALGSFQKNNSMKFIIYYTQLCVRMTTQLQRLIDNDVWYLVTDWQNHFCLLSLQQYLFSSDCSITRLFTIDYLYQYFSVYTYMV